MRVKPESELLFRSKLQKLEYMNRLAEMNAADVQRELSKYGLDAADDDARRADNDYYKAWLEQNGELEVSLFKGNRRGARGEARHASEVELIPRSKDAHGERAESGEKAVRKRGRPPIFKDKNVDIGESVLKADLDQFLEGAEVSSSGLSRADLERVMMGKFNPNRRYSNEAMWAALMDVKKGGSIYRWVTRAGAPRDRAGRLAMFSFVVNTYDINTQYRNANLVAFDHEV